MRVCLHIVTESVFGCGPVIEPAFDVGARVGKVAGLHHHRGEDGCP